MTKLTISLVSKRKKRCRCLVFHELVVLVLTIAIAIVQHADGFLFQQSVNIPTRNQEKCRSSSSLLSQKTDANIGARSMPFFTDPMESPKEKDVHADVSDNEFDDGTGNSMLPALLKLASMHCASQALNTAVRLKIPDILDQQQRMSVDELARVIEKTIDLEGDEDGDLPCNTDALFRIMRLLTTIDIVREEQVPPTSASTSSSMMSTESSFRFSLTPLGKALRTNQNKPSIASAVLHWMDEPLWDSWLEVPGYIRDGGYHDKSLTLLPFERANGAVSSDEYYNQDDNPESLRNANEFVRLIQDQELRAVVTGFDWSEYKHMRLVDIAGNNGKLADAIAAKNPDLDCTCLDLPSNINNIPERDFSRKVKLVPGNVMDPDTIPDCEVILMKHFCDRCMWFDDQTVEILRSCKAVLERSHDHDTSNAATAALPVRRKIVIADAVLPDGGTVNSSNDLPLYLDAMYMMVGRERQRTLSEWRALAEAADLELTEVIDTSVPTCSLIVLEPKKNELAP